MKFVCLGYYDESQFATMSESEQEATIEKCIAYDRELSGKGHFAGGMALQSADTATTVRWKNGKASLTDGPYAETKEMLGGVLILEARDKEEALSIMSRHPGIRVGPFEVRPMDEDFMARHPVLKEE
jgi:hypothetical protein